jgi:hypothetical protein
MNILFGRRGVNEDDWKLRSFARSVKPALRHKSGSIERSTMNARFASKNGRSGSGRISIARATMNLCVSNPHALAVAGRTRIAVSTPKVIQRIPYYR